MPYSGSAQTGSPLGIMTTVSEVGDFNGDGINDFVVGSPYQSGALGGNAFIIYGTTDGLPRDLDLANLDPGDGIEIIGADEGTLFQTGDLLGFDVRDAGDINGDGFADVVIGAPQDDVTYTSTYSYNTYVGYTYTGTYTVRSYGGYTSTYSTTYTVPYTYFYGYSTYIPYTSTYGYGGYSTYIQTYTNYGTRTYTNFFSTYIPVTYTNTYTYTSYRGYSTYTVGTYTGTRNDAGSAYVIFGTNTGPASIDVSALGSGGMQIQGPLLNANLGLQVTGVGDFNGDGVDDVAASANSYSTYNYLGDGAVFIVYGDSGSLPPTFDTGTLPSGDGTVLVTSQSNSGFGEALDGGQDLNGDGFGDVAVGAAEANVYSTYTSTYTSTFTNSIFLGSYSTTYTVPYTYYYGYSTYIPYTSTYGYGGYSTYTVTYTNFGTRTYTNFFPSYSTYTSTFTYTNTYTNYFSNAGQAYIFFGNTASVPPGVPINEVDLVGTNGFTFSGSNDGDGVGSDVAFIGDVNNDGLEDVLIGASGANGGLGEAYVVYGSGLPFPADMNAADLNGTNGFIIESGGLGTELGYAVAGVGDVNGDGIDDFAVSDFAGGEGVVYVVFGSSTPFPTTFNIASLDGTNGFAIAGFTTSLDFGQSVSGSDLNGDGFSDIMVTTNDGAFQLMGGISNTELLLDLTADPGFIDANLLFDPFVIGTDNDDDLVADNGTPSQMYGVDGNDTLRGSALVDEIDGGTGDDSIVASGGNDTVLGGRNDDTIKGGFGEDSIRGEAGNDDLRGGGDNDILIGDAGADLLYGQSGDDTLLGGSFDDYMDGGDDDDLLRGANGNDTLIGDVGDDRLIGDVGNDLLEGGDGNDNILGGRGFDTITGGAGDDNLQGNEQNDIFVFADGFGNDRIADFDATRAGEMIDLAAVSAITDFADLAANHMSQVGSYVLIDDGSGNTIRVDNVLIADMDASDFLF